MNIICKSPQFAFYLQLILHVKNVKLKFSKNYQCLINSPIMALTTVFVVVTLLVTLSNGFLEQPNFNFGDELFPEITYVPALPILQPPKIPGYPQIHLPQPPPLPVINFKKHSIPKFKPLVPPSFPNFEDMRNSIPKPSGTYHAVYLSSNVNSNGEGMAEILINNGGDTVYRQYVYPDTKQKNSKNNVQDFPAFKKHKLHKNNFDFGAHHTFEFPSIPKIKPMKFPEVRMPEIKPIDLNKMRNKKPASGEYFSENAYSSYSTYENNNGKETGSGGVSVLNNDNGKVSEAVETYSLVP